MKKALIIGTGLGGLTAALRLVKKGYSVEMVEKHHQAGGRLNELQKDGFTFDMAPTFFSMSYVFRDFLKDCNIDQLFEFVELDPLYTVNFRNNPKQYIIYKNLDKLAREFKDIEPGFQDKMEGFLKNTGKLFHDTEYKIINKNFKTFYEFLFQLMKVPLHHAPKMFRSVWQELSRYFSSYEVKVIFSLVAFFLGATPFDTPAVYSMLTYTELKHDGYFNVKGGMYQIVKSLIRELEKEQVKIHYHIEIKDFQKDQDNITGFIDQNGKLWTADYFIVNADAAWFRGSVMHKPSFSEEKLQQKKWTLAPFTMYLGVQGKIKKLDHHNYFLGNNFKEYASKIFKNSITLENPYYYVNVASFLNPGAAPKGCEAIFILCPVPDLRYKPNWEDRNEVANTIINDLSERTGFDIQKQLISRTILDPMQWNEMFNLYKGSGLGLAHDLNQIGYFRPKNKDEKYDNLYYVGSSTLPGTGLPMAVISSKLTIERMINDVNKKQQKKYQADLS
jgi:phytoene desaturase